MKLGTAILFYMTVPGWLITLVVIATLTATEHLDAPVWRAFMVGYFAIGSGLWGAYALGRMDENTAKSDGS